MGHPTSFINVTRNVNIMHTRTFNSIDNSIRKHPIKPHCIGSSEPSAPERSCTFGSIYVRSSDGLKRDYRVHTSSVSAIGVSRSRAA